MEKIAQPKPESNATVQPQPPAKPLGKQGKRGNFEKVSHRSLIWADTLPHLFRLDIFAQIISFLILKCLSQSLNYSAI